MDVINNDGLLSPGMFATVVLNNNGNTTAFNVPKTAVVTSTEHKYVLAMKNGKITKVDVSTGNTTTSSIEIFGEVRAGDTVIANANDEIKETNK